VNSLFPDGGGMGGGVAGPLEGMGPENQVKLTACSTQCRIRLQQNSCT
jgi:hypothetical protein